jgi:pimeloyl-ACP methyl ester carboxylesterase
MSRSSAKKSTIVRAKKAIILGSVRTAFGILERRAPGLGSRWAERLWLTPSRKPWIPRQMALLPSGEKFEIAVGVSTVRGMVWGRGPAVYLVHGWGGYRGQLDAFVEPLVEAGHRVVAFDVPGHGRSTSGAAGPRRALLPEFGASLIAAVDRFGPAHGVIAHSLGCAGTAVAVLDGLPVANLVFVSPVVDPVAFSRGFAQTLGFGERIRTGFLHVLEERVKLPMSVFDVPTRARHTGDGMLPPLLILHDLMDRESPYKRSEELAEAWRAELDSTEGLGHYRILRDPDVVGRAVRFVASPNVLTAERSGTSVN